MLPLLAFCLVQAPVICIDPGHPSEVGRGATGHRSTEIQVVYRVAARLAELLKSEGYRVVMTKSSVNQFVTNRRRAEIANASHASLLLRLHCDASSGSGFALYYPSQTGRVRGVEGPSESVLADSATAAKLFYPAMVQSLSGVLPSLGLKTDLQTAVGSRQGALTGSIFSHVPTLLVEMVVITNRKDEDWILSKSGMSKIVEALNAGVEAAVAR